MFDPEIVGKAAGFVATCVVFWWFYACLLPRRRKWIAIVLSAALNGLNLYVWYLSGADCVAARGLSFCLLFAAVVIAAIIRLINPVKPPAAFQSRFRRPG